MSFTKLCISVLCLLISTAVLATGVQPQISEVSVAGDQVFIMGSNFDNPEVSLGEFGLLLLDGLPSAELIVADLPDLIVPGDYKLTVRQGKGGKDQDDYDLTIGAVGPGTPVSTGLYGWCSDRLLLSGGVIQCSADPPMHCLTAPDYGSSSPFCACPEGMVKRLVFHDPVGYDAPYTSTCYNP
jgi:hypothetical protein